MDENEDDSRLPGKPRISAAGLRVPKRPSEEEPPPAHEIVERAVTELAVPAKRTKPLSSADWATFPDQPTSGGSPPMTIRNLGHLLDGAGIEVRYNLVKRDLEISVPDQRGMPENRTNVAISHIMSLAAAAGLSTGNIMHYLDALADENAYSPVAEWIQSKAWDKVDRLEALYATVQVAEDFSEALKQVLLFKWLLSAVAAVMIAVGFHCRGVLTFQGAQGIGKTRWFARLVTESLGRNAWIKLDHHLDPHNKDSVVGAVTHWICELGELDGSFKKDIARLKGFITRDSDKVRLPYAKAHSEYPRRTVFAASVNSHDFLVDDTGNSRFWVLPVVAVDYEHDIDMQQVFAQVAERFHAGAEWWLTPDEEAELESRNQQHRAVPAVEQRLLAALDLGRRGEDNLPAMTPTEVLVHIGYPMPTNPQCKECAAALRRLVGTSKRINGENRWRVPVRREDQPQPPRPPKDKFD